MYGIDRARIGEAVRKGLGQHSTNNKFGLLGRGALPIQYQTAATRRLNVNIPPSDRHFTQFAPGHAGGMMWNGPAYDPERNLIYTPMMDWPTSVKLAPISKLRGQPGQLCLGTQDSNFGQQDPKSQWGGYLTAGRRQRKDPLTCSASGVYENFGWPIAKSTSRNVQVRLATVCD